MNKDEKHVVFEYTKKEKSTHKIAEEMGTYPNKIRRILIKNGVILRDKSSAQSIAIDSGRHSHPTKGRRRTEDERIKANGWLDYSKWECPPYRENYTDLSLSLPKKYVVISNRYNLEHGDPPIGHFDIESLYNLFEYFQNNGYNVVYKRPKNTEFATDSNELLDLDITANVDGKGLMTDFDLVNHYDNVFLMDDLISEIGRGYNESQLNIFARSSGFVSMGGGSSILCSSFGKPVVIYVNTSCDIRPGYFDKNSYFRKLSILQYIQ